MIPSPVQALLEVFSGELADLRFGDMDAKGLAQIADEAQAATDAVTTAQATLDIARAKLLERQETLLHAAQRALAYARIYAETNDELRARLDGIALPRPAKRATATSAEELRKSPTPMQAKTGDGRRGRRRKGEGVAEESTAAE
ncbi:MAG TPA: hypothetical protein VNO21_05520 [Polyangiaceae bacterium]|nr:hypothetical protein [Polyangiaceae bacterium]